MLFEKGVLARYVFSVLTCFSCVGLLTRNVEADWKRTYFLAVPVPRDVPSESVPVVTTGFAITRTRPGDIPKNRGRQEPVLLTVECREEQPENSDADSETRHSYQAAFDRSPPEKVFSARDLPPSTELEDQFEAAALESLHKKLWAREPLEALFEYGAEMMDSVSDITSVTNKLENALTGVSVTGKGCSRYLFSGPDRIHLEQDDDSSEVFIDKNRWPVSLAGYAFLEGVTLLTLDLILATNLDLSGVLDSGIYPAPVVTRLWVVVDEMKVPQMMTLTALDSKLELFSVRAYDPVSMAGRPDPVAEAISKAMASDEFLKLAGLKSANEGFKSDGARTVTAEVDAESDELSQKVSTNPGFQSKTGF